MLINGIGEVSEETVLSILTREGREAVESGDMTLEEVGDMYKLEQVKKASRIGRFGDSFSTSYGWIPEGLFDKLTPGELGQLVDAFNDCYGAGKNDKHE
ncbi:hypothetical protein A8806_110177 [Faecalicatena orotica]|uniref:Uncharacterized protein n=1 Tax=Faecalicatena orotica TaxID=1544 RepID=A0A2Y9BKW8_9FIRM|nr:hypothetical protein [Faecalicatena orotica]PWJ28002.1 hypothetical protein A8806_110177 [Faecalicatena orotica]SSA57025.1 hypothetical protein SAMN05216536_110177 [Faecalicatena orotica]